MAQSAENRLSGNLILVPAVVTLAVTLLRLVGELQNWSPRFFSRAPGGGLAVVGISWLVPIFAVYFGIRLARAEGRPANLLAALGLVVLAIALVPLSGVGAKLAGLPMQGRRVELVFALASLVGAVLAWRAWPRLGRTLFLYALAARIPVAMVMLVAVYANWGTHYDVAPGLPPMSPLAKWFWIGLIPQLSIWIWFTMALGGLFGVVAGAIAGRARGTAPAGAAA